MTSSHPPPVPWEPPYTLRRPDGIDDFHRIERHIRYWWSSTRLYRPMQVGELSSATAEGKRSRSVPFHQTRIGRGGCINPFAKNWCFFLLEDAYRNIIGVYYGVGITQAAKERHLSRTIDELPIDDLPWSELHVPDPARPELTRYCYTIILTDWNKPHFTEPLIEATYKIGDLLRIDTIFTQVVGGGDKDHDWTAADFGFQFIRRCEAKTPARAPVSVWVWEREKVKSSVHRQFHPALSADASEIVALAGFYQRLSCAEREELVYMLQGYDIAARAAKLNLNRRAIEARSTGLRERLDRETGWSREGFRRLGIDPERGSSSNLPDLFGQPKVAQALLQIAWFYGELDQAA